MWMHLGTAECHLTFGFRSITFEGMHHFHRVFPEVLVPIKDNEHAVVNLKYPLMGIQVNHKSVQTIGPANKKIKKQALTLEKTRLDANKERKAKIKGTAKMLNRFKNKCK